MRFSGQLLFLGLNASGSKTANTRAKVSLHAIPLAKGQYSLKKSIFDSPNNTKSRQLSAPQILPHKTTNKISMRGYIFFLKCVDQVIQKNKRQILCNQPHASCQLIKIRMWHLILFLTIRQINLVLITILLGQGPTYSKLIKF